VLRLLMDARMVPGMRGRRLMQVNARLALRQGASRVPAYRGL